MKRIEDQLTDSDEKMKRLSLSDSHSGPSTSWMASPPESTPTIINSGCYFYNSIVTQQIIDKKPSKLVLESLDGFPSTPEIFIGRSGEIEELQELIQKHQKVLITGIAGIGKSRLAIECATKWVQAGKFTRAIFINVETERTAKERIGSIAETINVKSEVVKIYEFFNDHKLSSGLTLFVLDSVEKDYNIRQILPSKKHENIKILATSQDCEYQLLFREFKLNKLAKENAIELMETLFEKFRLDLEENENSRANFLSVQTQHIPSIHELVIKLDGHPLALHHACAFCVDTILYEGEDDISECITKYLDQIKVRITKEFPIEYDNDYQKTIHSAISLNIEKAIRKNTQVRDFLFSMCFLNPIFIEFKYFRNCGRFSEDEIKDCRRTLRKHSIIHIRDDISEDMNIHRLILVICLSMLRKDNLEAHIVEINFSIYLGDKRAHIYHSPFLFMHTKLERKDLAGPYIKAFKNSVFMSELSDCLKRVGLTVEDINRWNILHYCKFAGQNFWFNYFKELPEAIASKNLNVEWPLEIVGILKGNNVSVDIIKYSRAVVKDLTPLHFYAACGSDLYEFKRVIDKIEDKEVVTNSKLFHLATRNKNYDFGFELLKRGVKYEDKDMALLCAVLGQDLDLARKLIKEGADVNFTDYDGFSPIFLAIATANVAILNELQQKGANIEPARNIRDEIKNTALLSVLPGEFVASNDYKNYNPRFFCELVRYDDRSEADILTAVEWLIKIGAHINCSLLKFQNDPVLLFALRNRYVNVAVKLIDAGADVNKTNKRGDTPLMFAKRAKIDSSLVKLLEERTSICEWYLQSAPSSSFSDLVVKPERFLNLFWKWSLRFSRDPYDQKIRLETCKKIQTNLVKFHKNIRKLLRSTTKPSSEVSIPDLDEKISEILQIDLELKDTEQLFKKEIDGLDFSAVANVVLDNLDKSIKDAISWFNNDAPLIFTILAEIIFKNKFKLPANLFDLYEQYIDTKFDLLLKKGLFKSEKTQENDDTEVQLGAVRRVHQELAVRLLLPEESLPGLKELKKFKANYVNGEETLVRFGILTLKEGQLYLEPGFAEYFLTEYLISNFKSEEVQKLFLLRILIEASDFKLTREFFDSQLRVFFEDDSKRKGLMSKAADEGHKQLQNLKRNRLYELSVVEFTEKVKEIVSFALQEDKNFLLLKRVAEEDRTHIIIFLLIKFKSNMNTLLRMVNKTDKCGRTTLHYIAKWGKDGTSNVFQDFLIENFDLNENLKSLNSVISSTSYHNGEIKCILSFNTENLEALLEFLKQKLDQKNFKWSLEKTNQGEDTVLYILPLHQTENLKVFLNLLKANFDLESLKVFLKNIDLVDRTAVNWTVTTEKSVINKILLDFAQDNL